MRGGGAQFVHGRSRMTIDPRIPTMPGRSTSCVHQPGRHCLRQARSAMRCSTSRIKCVTAAMRGRWGGRPQTTAGVSQAVRFETNRSNTVWVSYKLLSSVLCLGRETVHRLVPQCFLSFGREVQCSPAMRPARNGGTHTAVLALS